MKRRTIAPVAVPRATMRLQLHKDFTFADAQAQVPYFARLGISHLYLSPILSARSGSLHGYDVVDHSAVNPELGGEAGFRELVATLRQHNMGVLVDIVPNHMAIGGHDNRLWLDVLEWGRQSRYANFFDIDWKVPDPVLNNKILAPFLGDAYGDALAKGDIHLYFCAERGRFRVEYYEHHFPIAPHTYPQILRFGGGVLSAWGKSFRDADDQILRQRGDTFDSTCLDLARAYAQDSTIREAIDVLLSRFDGNTASGQRMLHQLLERQHYRLSNWRNAADEINWRRFFDVIHLIGIRIQETAAFEVVHATVFRLYAEGLIDGVRIDHIDGLADPKMYCRRLRARLNRLARERPAEAPLGRAYIIVEKILAPEERLPREWQVDGTTGYSFMNDVSALLHDARGEQGLSALWIALSGRSGDFLTETQHARRRILQELLASEFNSCALALHRIARSDPRTRDWSLFAIRRVLQELLVQFPIYRTYADACGRSDADALVMRQSIEAARPQCRSADRPLLDLLDAWLGGEAPRDTPGRLRQARLRGIARFQQLSSPLAAKSVEDTAFYRHGQLLSRNEVGSNPAQFANTPADFHAECVRRARHFPHALLATSTHDHKRGEDVRTRLALLSEWPALWADVVCRWVDLNRPHKRMQHGSAQAWPVGGDEYMLYQTLIGCWPLELTPADRGGLQQLYDRLWQWWMKALREAKQLSSWAEPNTDYEQNCAEFLRAVLDPDQSAAFLAEVAAFVDTIAASAAVNGLTQTTLKLTTPGVADIYQGCEFWDFSLVDPDNRRAVDYRARSNAIQQKLAPVALLEQWRNGAIKQYVIARLLKLRAETPDLFLKGDYIPVEVRGRLAEHVFAHLRIWRNQVLLVAVTRFAGALPIGAKPLADPLCWIGTELIIPEDLQFSTVRNTAVFSDLLEGNDRQINIGPLPCEALFNELPIAVLFYKN